MRTWQEQYLPKGKPLIPLRMVRVASRARFCVCDMRRGQIPWSEDFEHATGRELFASNTLALTWVKGEAMPRELVDDILRGLGLERETREQRRGRLEVSSSSTASSSALL